MAFNDIEKQKIKMVLDTFLEKRRPPEEIRDQLDLSYRFDNQTVIVFEVRPLFNKPDEKMEIPVAKATYERKSDSWKIYWQRANMKWVSYDPSPVVKSLDEFLRVIDEDAHYCFWG